MVVVDHLEVEGEVGVVAQHVSPAALVEVSLEVVPLGHRVLEVVLAPLELLLQPLHLQTDLGRQHGAQLLSPVS